MILKTAKSIFVPANPFCPRRTINLERFPSVPNCRMLRLARRHRVLQNAGVLQCGGCGAGVIALFAWAPHAISVFYVVKSAMRLINSGSGAALCSLSQGVVRGACEDRMHDWRSIRAVRMEHCVRSTRLLGSPAQRFPSTRAPARLGFGGSCTVPR
jgi:hypothetical protein